MNKLVQENTRSRVRKNEDAKFWVQVVTELKNRGVEQIYVACVDGLKGFPEVISSIFPNTIVQLCIVHSRRVYRLHSMTLYYLAFYFCNSFSWI